jgi:hypothetical protein
MRDVELGWDEALPAATLDILYDTSAIRRAWRAPSSATPAPWCGTATPAWSWIRGR